MHYGVKGMKWGVRRAVRGHGGPGIYVSGNKKKLAGYKKDLKVLNDGGHLSVGGTKKRQAAYDKRDRANLEKKIAKTESKIAEKENMTPEQQKAARRKTALKVGAAAAGTALAAYGAYKASEAIKEKAFKINQERGNKAVKSYMSKYSTSDLNLIRDSLDSGHAAGEAYGNRLLFSRNERMTKLSNKLYKDTADYVDRNSKKLIPAIKTVMGKNREFTTAELLNMGLKVAGYEKLY